MSLSPPPILELEAASRRLACSFCEATFYNYLQFRTHQRKHQKQRRAEQLRQQEAAALASKVEGINLVNGHHRLSSSSSSSSSILSANVADDDHQHHNLITPPVSVHSDMSSADSEASEDPAQNNTATANVVHHQSQLQQCLQPQIFSHSKNIFTILNRADRLAEVGRLVRSGACPRRERPMVVTRDGRVIDGRYREEDEGEEQEPPRKKKKFGVILN